MTEWHEYENHPADEIYGTADESFAPQWREIQDPEELPFHIPRD